MLPFCRRILFVTALLFTYSTNLHSQTVSPTDTSITLVTLILNDGTRIWGTLHSENQTAITVYDFNLGEVLIVKENVRNEEREKAGTGVIVETVNNSSYYGNIIGATVNTLIMQSAVMDTFTIQTNIISKITLSGSYVNRKGVNWFTNPNATRYFFAPSAIPLKKKEGYFQNAYLLANSVNVGVTDNITIGGGVVIPVLFYVTPKISYQVSKNIYAGGGVLFTQSFISEFNLSAGIGYGLLTFGNREHNFTLGGGYGFSKFDSTYRATKRPIATLNGMTRIGKRLSLVTENWLIPRAKYNEEQTAYDSTGMPFTETIEIKRDYYTLAASVGLRFMPGVKTSVDFSVVAIRTNPFDKYLVLPYLDFVYKFN